jgi:hypothetical protein
MVAALAGNGNCEKFKKSTIEASMSLKIKEGSCKTEQNEPENNPKRTQFECEMRAINAQFEIFYLARVPAGHSGGGTRLGSETDGSGNAPGSARKYKKSGNEAKKYLKTKDITFLNAVDSAHFTRN